MIDKTTLKILVSYSVILIILLFVLFNFLTIYKASHFSEQEKDKILTSSSQNRFITKDPCANSILGDPTNSKSYFKIIIHCNSTTSSTNTLTSFSKSNPSYVDALKELSQINSFTSEFESNKIIALGNLKNDDHNKWACFLDSRQLPDLTIPVQNKATLECFYEKPD